MYELIYPENAHIPGLKALWQEAFGDSIAEIDNFFATAFSPTRCLCIPAGNAIAAGAYWLDCRQDGRKLAYIYAVATASAFRGQGLCHRLMAGIHDALEARGYAGSILVPDAGLEALYRPMGYEFFGGMEEFSCQAGQPTALQEIGLEEYAALRRQYLPRGGVLQEGQSLRYLQTMARLYRGEDFLLAASVGEEFFAMELLGNRVKAPAILGALGHAQGRFRCPGKENFAMFRPIGPTPPPTYFALAFD